MSWDLYWSDLLSKKKLKEKIDEMNLVDKQLDNSMTIEEICHQIYNDYTNWNASLKEIKKDFLQEIDGIEGVHLQCSRIKTMDSLIVKVITKRYENIRNKKSNYSRILGNNYKDIVTDLIGLRLIISYRGKWTTIHNGILELFPFDAKSEYYSQMELLPHPINKNNIQVERPKVYYAKGDNVEQYKEYGLDVKIHKMGYRSIHYTVSFRGVYIEIQVRTIYDEAWSDCNHNYVYKHDENKSHTALVQISDILCKLTNLSNDIGEGMRNIYEKQSMLEIEGNRWETSKEVLDLFDVSLERMKDVYGDLNEFRQRLEFSEEVKEGGTQ